MIDAREIPIQRVPPVSGTNALRIPRVPRFKLPLILALAHLPLGVMLWRAGTITLVHPLAVLALGLCFALRRTARLERVALVVAYLIGAEVLWRMTRVPVYWEFGKYAAAALMITALIRRGRWNLPRLPMLYFSLLLPACYLTLVDNNMEDARAKISFNLSGPFLIFVSFWFFSNVRLTPAELRRLLTFLALPLISVAVILLNITTSWEQPQFSNESNYITSGFFGPNQVSAMLGLGVFACLASFILFETNLRVQLYLGALALLFAGQSALTFSRGGLYAALGATTALALLQYRELATRFRKLIPILAVSVVFLAVVFPYINDYTGGKLQERFESTTTTNRFEIIESEIRLFLENPFLGVGVGGAKTSRTDFTDIEAASHTEFTRVISEHGMLGILALGALGAFMWFAFRKQGSRKGRALAAGTLVWSTLFMLNSGVRLAAPAFMLGLAAVSIVAPGRVRNRAGLRIRSERLPSQSD